MKNIIYTTLLVIALLPGIVFAQTVKGSGTIIKKDISVSGFNKITSLGSFNIYLKQSDAEKLTVEGDDNIVQYFSAEVSGRELNLTFTKNVSPTKFDVYVEVKELNKFSGVGSGDIKTMNTIKADKFKLEMVGSGNLDFAVSSTDLKIEVTGSGNSKINAAATNCSVEHTGSGDMTLSYDNNQGNIKAEHTGSGDMTASIKSMNAMISNSGSGNFIADGNTANLKLENDGSGDFKGDKFATDKLNVEVNGSGNVNLTCNSEAAIELNGSGDLFLSGNYKVNKIETNGSGRLKK
ncbi:MAG: DUF2807 domain-containing protein [Bacteroidetes bacterium]|nr:DUF2807 domain-containing protein [Bacteroidota bacterium]